MTPVSQISSRSVSLEFPFTQADFQIIAGIVYERSGIVLAAHKRDMTYCRLVQRLRALGLSSFHDYCVLLTSSHGDGEVGYLVNAITTNLTKFFREPHHFDHFKNVALPELGNATRGERPCITVWSAGCSSGEEPYSIAMAAIAARAEIGREWDLHILATDLDTAMLQKAKACIYPADSLDNVPARMRERFFEMPPRGNAGGVLLSKAAQSLVEFKQLNLLGPWPASERFDVIFCRNVMIYFDAKTKATLVERFHSVLNDGGWLYVGHSESLLDHQTRFKLSGRTIYQKLNP
ncbi:MAG: CheR family methyltransferase [Rhodomicrobium sp.]